MEPGRVLSGRYELEHEIGSGGAAVVWLARDRSLDRSVAIKVLHPGLDRDEDTVARFRREARSAAALNHRNAVAIYDIGADEDGEVFIVMEHVAGPGLHELLQGRPLAPAAVTAVGFQVACALAAAHDSGLIHRDIKPANILIAPDGQAKVVDFGIAKAIDTEHTTLTRAGTVVGTVAYLAPEQIKGEDVSPRTDVYALGLVLYEALAGETPFGSGTPAEVTARRLASDPPSLEQARPDLPDELTATVARATRLDPDERYADGREFADVLERLLTDEPEPLVRRLARSGGRGGGGDVEADATQVLSVPGAAVEDTVAVDLRDHEEGIRDREEGRRRTPADRTTVPPVLPERKEDRPQRDPLVPPDTRAPIIAVLTGLALILGAWSLFGGDGGDGGEGNGGGGGGGDAEPQAVEVSAAQDFDPFGDGEEHREDTPKAHDGDPGTAWVTETYDSADMGGLKPGVGLVFDLGAEHDVARIELTLSPGLSLEVFLGPDAPDGTDPEAWGTRIDSIDGASESASIEVPPDARGRYALVWITSVGGAGERAEIAEARFLAR